MRPVAPVHADTDQRVIHWAELLDSFVGSSEKTFDAIARTAESFQGSLQLDRGILGVWLSQIVGFGAVIARPENADFGSWTFLLPHATNSGDIIRFFAKVFRRCARVYEKGRETLFYRIPGVFSLLPDYCSPLTQCRLLGGG